VRAVAPTPHKLDGFDIGLEVTVVAHHQKPRLFIASSTEYNRVAKVLADGLQKDDVARASVWDEGFFRLGELVADEVSRATHEYDFGVFVFGADDTVELRGERLLVARDNVVFECGLFVGERGRRRSFIVREKLTPPLHLPSDLNGILTASFDLNGRSPADADLETIAQALRSAVLRIGDAIRKSSPPEPGFDALSGGMVYVLRHLALHTRNLHSVTEILRAHSRIDAATSSERERMAWLKAAKYCCQCLQALGLAHYFGGDEYTATPYGRQVLESPSLRDRFDEAFARELAG